MERDTKTAGIIAVKDLIDELETKYGSLRKAAEAIGIYHQKLSTWRKSPPKQREFLEDFETIRKALGITKSKMWERILNRKID